MSQDAIDVLNNPAASSVYAKYSLKPGQIRLLSIHPSPDLKAKVSCSLNLHVPKDRPYRTLSYVWGGLTGQSFPTILLEGVEVKVTPNLDRAMRHIRDASKDVVIWIDAISINQMNDAEKTEQVKRMSEIYEGSEETTVWLSADECPRAANFLQHWARRFVEVNGGNEMQVWASWYGPQKSVGNLPRSIRNANGPFSMSGLGSLEAANSLITRPWWQRLWTFQEAVLPKSLYFQCGSTRINGKSMEILAVLLELGYIKHNLQIDKVIFEVFKWRYRWHNFRQPHDVARFYDALPLVSQLAHRLVTNPKDKIFAVAGLMKRTDIVHINYKDNLGHAYASFAFDQAMYWPSPGTVPSPNNSHLRILSYAGIGHVQSTPPLAAPTWTPDWRLYDRRDNSPGSREMPIPLDAPLYSAGAARMSVRRAYGTLQVIIFKGILFDKISKKGSEVQSSPSRALPRWPDGVSSHRTLFETSKGYFGLGPVGVQVGDDVCVIFGCNVPHILRANKRPNQDHREHLLVGEAFVRGIMKGQVIKMVEDNNNDIRPVDIRLH